MAIIQISRIQNRRGRKLTDVGMPQLSSGEIGWAIDTQELYIGNGSVSEGAPAVGNTKILTEHDDIFSLANKYKYKENNALWGNTTPAALTVQEKLDEWVSVRAFGALGDGTNQTASLQNAIDSLFIRAPSIKDNVKLYIPAGNYVIDGPLYVPPFAHIIGDGIGKTKITASDTAFITCNGTSVSGAYVTANSIGINEEDTNQARNIVISGMTITNDHVNPCFILNDTANSTFNNIEMTNTWLPGENEGNQVGFRITGTNTTPACTSENIHIHDISFSVNAGTVVALVGSSGSGKSTIAGLAASFLTQQSGKITVDGKDLSKVDLNSFRKHLGVVLQDDFLFEGTIRENILFPRPNASEAQLQEAVKAAYVDEFTDRFEDGLDTLIGERGIKLSGGQRQRIAIARAVLADPRILILDEATSNLDTESEALIQKSLSNLTEGRTTFVIAHRLSTIRKADQILVIENGRIAEQGTHESLIAKEGRYYNLFTYQARI